MAGAIGRLLRNRRAGEATLIWNRPEWQGPETLSLTSPAFAHGESMPRETAGNGAGDNVSPELVWSGVPAEAASLTLVLQDPDVPLPRAITHFRVTGLPPADGGIPRGATPRYRGPRPIPGHGPHAYVFQLYALDASGAVVARGRLDGSYER